MRIISKHSEGKILKNDVLALSQEAKKAKQLDNTVVNATIGSLYDDNGCFYSFENIDKLVKSLPNEDFYSYSPSNGNIDFHNAVIDWVFGDYQNLVLNNMHVKSIPTPGGTGAVSNALYNALDEGEVLLLPDIYWTPYKNMAESNGFDLIEYPFIVDGKFNMTGFVSCCEQIIKRQGKVVTILNDPCNNPTGYTLSNEEFKAIIEYMNTKNNVPFNVIYDIAYFDYYQYGMKESRKKFEIITEANENILFNIAFSCSKTFSIYGLRLGAQIITSKNEQFVNDIYNSTCFLARTRWSNVSKPGLSMMIKIYKDPELKTIIEKELREACELVNKRAAIFKEEAEVYKLKSYPFSGGFFITVHCDDGIKVAEELKKEKVFVLGLKKAIRIAICSIPTFEVKGLAEKISKVINR